MALIDTIPAVVEVATTEVLTYGFNPATLQAETDDTGLSNPVTEMIDTTPTPNKSVTLLDAPVVGSLPNTGGLQGVLQKIRGSELTAGHVYWLVATFTGTPSGSVWSMRLTVQCPF